MKGVASWFVIGGTDFTTQTNGSNVATIIVALQPWDERKSQRPATERDSRPRRSAAFAEVPEAFTFAFGLPPILGLSITGGFQFMLEDRAGGELTQLSQVADALVDAARKHPEIGNVVSTFRASVPAYSVDMDLDKLQTLGVPVTDAYNALQTFLGGLYVNDFNRFSHTWQVLMQAEPEFRNQPSDIDRFYVRSADGNMVPLGTLASVKPTTGPDVVYRYNRFRAIQILGGPRAGRQLAAKPSTRWKRSRRNAAVRLRLRMDRHHLSAEAGAGARRRHLRIRRRAGFPVPGRAL